MPSGKRDISKTESTDVEPPLPISPIGLLRGFGIFLGWLTGSLAGITAFFYAVGFLATIASLSYLGLNIFLIDYDSFVYLARGANATMFFALELGRFLIILSPLVALYPLTRRMVRALVARGRQLLPSVPLSGVLRKYWRGTLYAFLFLYMYFILDRYIPKFNQYLGIGGVLQNPTPLTNVTEPWVRDLLCGNVHQLKTNFLVLSVVTIVAGIVTIWAYQLTRAMRYRQMLLLPFVAILIMFVFMIPGIYGVTFLSQSASPISIAEAKDYSRKELYLIGRGAADIVVWDVATHSFSFLRSATINKMKVMPPVAIHRIHPGLKAGCSNIVKGAKSGVKSR